MFSRLVARRVPRLASMPVRYSSSAKEGSVAQSKEFQKKEQGYEKEYILKQEQAKLQKLKADIELKKAELEKLEKQHADIEKK